MHLGILAAALKVHAIAQLDEMPHISIACINAGDVERHFSVKAWHTRLPKMRSR